MSRLGDYCQICSHRTDKNGINPTFFSFYQNINGKEFKITIALHISCIEKEDNPILEFS